MRDHIAPFVYYLEVHLLYASILCLAAWALTSIRGASATWKYWIWVATSINFMLPLGGFFNGFGGSRVSWATQLGGLDDVGIGISRNLTAGAVILGVWLCGAAFMSRGCWCACTGTVGMNVAQTAPRPRRSSGVFWHAAFRSPYPRPGRDPRSTASCAHTFHCPSVSIAC